jgi:hypothetical protein
MNAFDFGRDRRAEIAPDRLDRAPTPLASLVANSNLDLTVV